MNPNPDNALEARIDRELKSLPLLAAPPSLAPRVMVMVASRAVGPWHRRAWQTWPVALRAMSLAVLLAFFGGLCVAGWQFSHSSGVVVATERAGGVLAVLNLAAKTLGVLADAGSQVIHHFGAGAVYGLIAVAMLGYAMLLGLGAAGYRLAYAQRWKGNL